MIYINEIDDAYIRFRTVVRGAGDQHTAATFLSKKQASPESMYPMLGGQNLLDQLPVASSTLGASGDNLSNAKMTAVRCLRDIRP